MTRFNLLALSTAALLVLAGCGSESQPEPNPTPVPPAPAPDANIAPATADVIQPVTNEPALRATTLGTLNGCRIDRVIVDGKAFVLASAYAQGGSGRTSSYAARSCQLEPLR